MTRTHGVGFDATHELSDRDVPTDEPWGEAQAPARLGRFTIVRRVGAGGMGVVYAAYDEELDRRIAVKLLHGGAEAEAVRVRLQREARALAKLSHPNVVHVYEVGRIDERIYVAMEYVDGKTLRRWHEERAPWPEVLGVYRQAAAGLAAAHAVGLVHRDFKPDNAILGADGRVRVLDFGLARAADTTGPPAAALRAAEASPGGLDRVTQTGAVVGTPAYMAPEQFLGEPTDARTDVFAFCVALYEALYGERPFAGDTRIELLVNVTQGQRRPAPTGTRVPAWLHQVVVSGLAAEPDARPADMQTLVTALASDPRRKVRRRAAFGFGGVALVGFGWMVSSFASEAGPCTGLDEPIRAVWSADDRHEVIDRLASVDARFADAAAQRVDAVLDAYATSWVEHRVQACEATHVRREQSESRLDAAMACLADRRLAFEALLRGLRQAGVEEVAAAPAAAETLPVLPPCLDASYLEARVEPPPEAVAAGVDRLRAELADAGALRSLGAADDARARLEETLREARRLGYRPLVAAVAVELARLQLQLHASPGAVVELAMEAATAAEAVGDSEATVAAFVHLAGALDGRADEADRWDRLAMAGIEALGAPAMHLHATLLRHRASRARDAGDEALALASLEEALALTRQRFGDDAVETATSLLALAELLSTMGSYDEARKRVTAAERIAHASLSADHPVAVDVLMTRGNILAEEGRTSDALGLYDTALERLEEAVGPEHPLTVHRLQFLAAALSSISADERALELAERAYAATRAQHGDAARETGLSAFKLAATALDAHDQDRAREVATVARSILELHVADDALTLANVHGLLGGIAFEGGELDAALEHARQVVEIRSEAYGGRPHDQVAGALSNLGMVFERMQRATDAERSYREALRLSAATRGPDHPDVAERRFLLGRVVIAQGRPDEAVEHFTDAERILLVRSAPPDALARTRWALARAQVETGAVAEAIENARAARADFLAAKDSAEVDAIDRFIAQQGPPAGSTGHGRP